MSINDVPEAGLAVEALVLPAAVPNVLPSPPSRRLAHPVNPVLQIPTHNMILHGRHLMVFIPGCSAPRLFQDTV
jgi:hypothetical protein